MAVKELMRLNAGNLLVTGGISQRSPSVLSGLVAHFPCDGQGGLVSDSDFKWGGVKARYLSHYGGLSGVNLLKPSDIFSRIEGGPNSTIEWDEKEQAWKCTGCVWAVMNTFIQLDPNKHWYISAEFKRTNGEGVVYFGDIAYNMHKSTSGIVQHPGAYEYWGTRYSKPTSNEWTEYTNQTLGGSPRTGESTDKTQEDKFHTGTRWIRPLFICNYPNEHADGITYVRNIRLWYEDDDESNIIPLSQGLGLTSIGVNAETRTDFKGGGWHTGQTEYYIRDVNYDRILPPEGIDSTVVDFIPRREGSYMYNYSPCVPQEQGKYYVPGVWIKTNWKNGLKVQAYCRDSWTSEKIIVPDDGQWHFIYWSRQQNTGGEYKDTLSFQLLYMGLVGVDTCGEEGRTYMCAPQLVEGNIPKQFRKGNQTIGSKFVVPYVLDPNAGSIVMDMTALESINNKWGQWGGDRYWAGNQQPWDAAGSFYLKYSQTDVFIRCCYTHKNWYDIPLGIQPDIGARLRLVITYNTSAGKIEVFLNGEKIKSVTDAKITTCLTEAFKVSSIWGHAGHAQSGTYNMEHILHSLTIYNRTLTDDDVKSLESVFVPMKREEDIADLYLRDHIDQSPRLPHFDTRKKYHFPLSGNSCLNGCESMRLIPEEQDDDQAYYEDGMMYIGNSVDNYAYGPKYTWVSGTGIIRRDVSTDEMMSPIFRTNNDDPVFPEVIYIENTGDGTYQVMYTVSEKKLTQGVEHYLSAWVYLLESGGDNPNEDTILIGTHWMPWKTVDFVVPVGKWVRIGYRFLADRDDHIDHTVCTEFGLRHGGAKMYCTAPQIDRDKFKSPPMTSVTESRPMTRSGPFNLMKFNKPNWAICGVIKCMSANSDEMPIEIKNSDTNSELRIGTYAGHANKFGVFWNNNPPVNGALIDIPINKGDTIIFAFARRDGDVGLWTSINGGPIEFHSDAREEYFNWDPDTIRFDGSRGTAWVRDLTFFPDDDISDADFVDFVKNNFTIYDDINDSRSGIKLTGGLVSNTLLK